MRWLIAVCLLITGCVTSSRDAAGVAYLPRTAWTDQGDWEFKENWVARHLRAMDEPSLLATSMQLHSTRVYRLVVVPSFQPAYAIRVTENPNGSGDAVFVQLDGQGGYEPGSVRRRIQFHVSRMRMAALRDQFEMMDFWALPVEPRHPPSALGEEYICTDGTLFMFEAVTDGRHHVVMPHNCPGMAHNFARLASDFRQIANLHRY